MTVAPSVRSLPRQPITRAIYLSIYLLWVTGPILYLGLTSLYQAFQGSPAWEGSPILSGRSTLLLLKSSGLAGSIALLSTLSGWLVAVWLWSKSYRWTWSLIWVSFCLAAIPPGLHAISWFQLNTLLRDWLPGLLVGPLKGWVVTVIIAVQAYLPLSIGCAYLGLRSIPLELIEAGRSSQTDFKTLVGVVLPLCKPALLAGAGIVFLLSLLDYSLPSLLQLNVYSMEIFAVYSLVGSPQQAFITALPLLLIGLAAVVGLTRPVCALALRSASSRPAWTTPAVWPLWFGSLLSIAAGLAVLMGLVLLVVLIALSGGPTGIYQSLSLSGSELFFSLLTSILALLLGLIPAWLAARAVAAAGKTGWLAWGLILLPLGIPATLAGAGVILLRSNLPYDTGILSGIGPGLVDMARFTPVLALLLAAQMLRRDPSLQDAAMLFQKSSLRRWFNVALPLLAPGLALGAALVFILSMSELAGTLMVIPPGQATLSMRIYNYLHYGASERVAGLCLILVVAALVVSFLAGSFSRGSRAGSWSGRSTK